MDGADKRINVRFFDENLKFIGELDSYVGLEFISRWIKYGEFKLFVHRIDPMMQKGHYIMLNNDHRKTGIIKRIQCSDDSDSSTEVAGFTCAHLLTQRITFLPAGRAYHAFYAPAEDIICGVVTANMTDAADPRRNISLIEVKPSQGRGDKLQWQTRYNNLSDEVETLCSASGLGIAVELDPERRKLIFEVLSGVDRSAENGVRPPMVFNVDYDNVMNREYISDISEYKNTAITAGQGEGADRKIHIEGEENAGIDRYELFVDARDIEKEEQLPDRGKSKLAECVEVNSYSSAVDGSQYQTKWNLGDIVVTKDDEYNVYMNERIMEVYEMFDESGYTVSPTFGATVKTILDKVEDIGKNEPIGENTKGDPGEPGEIGPQGYSLQYNWKGTQLGVKREDETSYRYTDLRGASGPPGATGADGKTPKLMINSDGHLIAIYE